MRILIALRSSTNYAYLFLVLFTGFGGRSGGRGDRGGRSGGRGGRGGRSSAPLVGTGKKMTFDD